jgi:hypothetical protein
MGESICDSGMQCASRGVSWKENAEGTQFTGVKGLRRGDNGPDESEAIDDAGETIWLLLCSMDISPEIDRG